MVESPAFSRSLCGLENIWMDDVHLGVLRTQRHFVGNFPRESRHNDRFWYHHLDQQSPISTTPPLKRVSVRFNCLCFWQSTLFVVPVFIVVENGRRVALWLVVAADDVTAGSREAPASVHLAGAIPDVFNKFCTTFRCFLSRIWLQSFISSCTGCASCDIGLLLHTKHLQIELSRPHLQIDRRLWKSDEMTFFMLCCHLQWKLFPPVTSGGSRWGGPFHKP